MIRPYDLLETVLIDVEKGIRSDINVDILAKRYSLSYRHLQRIFKTAFKQTLADYIRSRKLAASLDDLFKTDLKLFAIALEYGFGYEQTYIRAFKREYGITPGHLRKSRHFARTKLPLYLYEKNKFPNGLFTIHFLDGIL
jgi:AraC family transcriptional regulator